MKRRHGSTGWRQVTAAAALLIGGLSAWGQATGPAEPLPWGTGTRPSDTHPANAPGPVKGSTITDEQVVNAMKRGIDFLLATKQGDNWESGTRWIMAGQRGGETALILYTLLHSGESLRDDPDYGPLLTFRSKELAPAVGWLSKVDPQETYTASLQASALALVPQKPDEREPNSPRMAMQRAFRFLTSSMGAEGGYTYAPPRSALMNAGMTRWDLSNSQYGALGMWALEDAGIHAPAGYWQVTDKFWRAQQSITGSWPYAAGNRGIVQDRDSMGLAGIATLFAAQEFVDKTLRTIPKADPNIEMGMAWLNGRFSPEFGDLYSMYSIERVGLASGYKYFGTKDWYRLLAANIVSHQNEDGSWDAGSWPREFGTFNGAAASTCTSYALLFLARGRNPVLFNKLQYEGGGTWNARPRDDAFLTRYLSKRFERPLNWQIVNLKVNAEEWLDAPILLITGSRDPKFTPDDIEKIRAFINGGGMVFSTSDEASPAFTNAIRKYAGEVVNGRYEMRTLQKTHMLYNSQLNADLTNAPPLLGMSNGIREIWIHCAADLGASWQLQRFTSKPHFEIPTALYFYATGKVPMRGKLKTLMIPNSAAAPARSLSMARVSFSGNWDPEPGAWPRLAKILRGQGVNGVDLQLSPTTITALDPAKTPVAHMVGTARFLVKDADCLGLRQYLDGGGLLIVDAGGGTSEFMASFLQMMAVVYPEATPEALPPDHAIYSGIFADSKGDNVRTVDFRKYTTVTLGKKLTEPVIEAITVKGRVRVLLSRYDITSGLVGNNTWGITGYSPESAQKLGGNLVRWAMEAKRDEVPGAQEAPATRE